MTLEQIIVRQLLSTSGQSGSDHEEIGRHENTRYSDGFGSDRIAQTVVKLVLEPMLEPVFDEDSFGYRPGRSALDTIAVTRKRVKCPAYC